MKKAVFAWSSGKDAAYGLHRVMQNNEVKVEKLFTTVTGDFDRVSIHGTREGLLDKQAERIGIPLEKVRLSADCTEEEYRRRFEEKLREFSDDFDVVVFSDLFLEEVREKRENQLEGIDIEGYWPIWGEDTEKVAEEISEKFDAYVVCVNGEKLENRFVGRKFDKDFLADLPRGADPCGENGEFHTFVVDAPYMDKEIELEKGETVSKKTAEGENHFVELEEKN